MKTDVDESASGTEPEAGADVKASEGPPDKEEWLKGLADVFLKIVTGWDEKGILKRGPEPRFTKLGTRCARGWDDAWIARVEEAEDRLQRRVCGARTIAGNPCSIEPSDENGRCRFHGGFALTGGQPGNRNAVIHGLYSRRLRVCDGECPLWGKCPCAKPDIKDLPATERPTCPYEQTEYNAALTDALDRVSRNAQADAFDLHAAHNLALLQVMLTRASLAMRNGGLTDVAVTTGEKYGRTVRKQSPYFQAFMRIAGEHRRCGAALRGRERVEPEVHEHLRIAERAMHDTDLNPDKEQHWFLEGFPLLDQLRRYGREAIEHAAAGREVAMLEAFQSAAALDPTFATEFTKKLIKSYRPKGKVLPEAAVAQVLRHITGEDDEACPETALAAHLGKLKPG